MRKLLEFLPCLVTDQVAIVYAREAGSDIFELDRVCHRAEENVLSIVV